MIPLTSDYKDVKPRADWTSPLFRVQVFKRKEIYDNPNLYDNPNHLPPNYPRPFHLLLHPHPPHLYHETHFSSAFRAKTRTCLILSSNPPSILQKLKPSKQAKKNSLRAPFRMLSRRLHLGKVFVLREFFSEEKAAEGLRHAKLEEEGMPRDLSTAQTRKWSDFFRCAFGLIPLRNSFSCFPIGYRSQAARNVWKRFQARRI